MMRRSRRAAVPVGRSRRTSARGQTPIAARVRCGISLLVVALLLGVPACEDPVIILGDVPGTMRRVAGVVNRTGSTLGDVASDSRLHLPAGVAASRDGMLYIADTGNGRVLEVSPSSAVRVIAGGDACETQCPEGPLGVAVGADGDVWIADPDANRLFRWHSASGGVSVAAGNGTEGDAPDGTPAVDAALGGPAGVAIAGDGTVYFSERGGHRVRMLSAQGTLFTVAGTGEAGYGGDRGDAGRARLHQPIGLTTDGEHLFIADAANHRIREVDLSTGIIRTVAGSGVRGFSASDTLALTALLDRPEAVAVTSDGLSLFVADTENNRVRLVDLESGRISTFAGTGMTEEPRDMTGAGATPLRLPAGVATFDNRNVFISDTGHQVVWRTRFGY